MCLLKAVFLLLINSQEKGPFSPLASPVSMKIQSAQSGWFMCCYPLFSLIPMPEKELIVLVNSSLVDG